MARQTKGTAETKATEGKTTTPPEDGKNDQNPIVKVPNRLVSAPNRLNLREGPYKSYAALTVLEDGAGVELLPLPSGMKVPGWSLVTTPDYTGWVMDEFLRFPEEA